MKALLLQLLRYLRRQAWGLIVAYMVGLHNFYHGDNKSPDDIVITTEQNEAQENGTPKD
jgi:hypothetical protein